MHRRSGASEGALRGHDLPHRCSAAASPWARSRVGARGETLMRRPSGLGGARGRWFRQPPSGGLGQGRSMSPCIDGSGKRDAHSMATFPHVVARPWLRRAPGRARGREGRPSCVGSGGSTELADGGFGSPGAGGSARAEAWAHASTVRGLGRRAAGPRSTTSPHGRGSAERPVMRRSAMECLHASALGARKGAEARAEASLHPSTVLGLETSVSPTRSPMSLFGCGSAELSVVRCSAERDPHALTLGPTHGDAFRPGGHDAGRG